MIGFRSQPRFCAPLLLLAALTATGSAALAQDNKQSEIPTCDKKIGTMSVAEPEQKWWLQYNLESPEALLRCTLPNPSASPWWIAAGAWPPRNRSVHSLPAVS